MDNKNQPKKPIFTLEDKSDILIELEEVIDNFEYKIRRRSGFNKQILRDACKTLGKLQQDIYDFIDLGKMTKRQDTLKIKRKSKINNIIHYLKRAEKPVNLSSVIFYFMNEKNWVDLLKTRKYKLVVKF